MRPTLELRAPTVTLPQVVAQAVATIALGLLGASGVAKLIDPEPTTGAMATAGMPSSHLLSRLLGITEIAGATFALVVGGLALGVAAVLYLSFAAFTSLALVRNLPIQSCGCFGREDTPPTLIHVVFNLGAAGALIALAFSGQTPIDWSLDLPALVLYLGFSIIGVYASYLLLARLPQVLGRTRSA